MLKYKLLTDDLQFGKPPVQRKLTFWGGFETLDACDNAYLQKWNEFEPAVEVYAEDTETGQWYRRYETETSAPSELPEIAWEVCEAPRR